MSVEGLQPPGVIGGYSGRVWQGFPINGIRNGEENGFIRDWEFGRIKPSTNINAAEAYWDMGLRAFGSDGGSLTYFSGIGSDTGMTLAADGDNEGVGLRDQLVQCRISRADSIFAWETVFETDTITDTKNGFFLGLIENSAITATSPIAAAGTLADLNFVGFHRLEGDGDKLDLVYKANGVTQVTVLADAITLVAGTEYRIGMTYRKEQDPFTESRYVFRWWLNGVNIVTGTSYKVIPSADGTDFPNDVAMGAIWTMLNATASTPGGLILKRARYGQVFLS
jgi:hypothetical protein